MENWFQFRDTYRVEADADADVDVDDVVDVVDVEIIIGKMNPMLKRR